MTSVFMFVRIYHLFLIFNNGKCSLEVPWQLISVCLSAFWRCATLLLCDHDFLVWIIMWARGVNTSVHSFRTYFSEICVSLLISIDFIMKIFVKTQCGKTSIFNLVSWVLKTFLFGLYLSRSHEEVETRTWASGIRVECLHDILKDKVI